MRILQIAHGFPPDSIAGTEKYCEALSQHLLWRGHECMVLAGTERSAPEATLATVEQDGLLVSRYLRAEGRARLWTEEYDPEADRLARHLLALVQPDIVHLHHWQRLSNNLVAICADQGIPVVVTLHDVWTSCPRVHRIRSDEKFCTDPPVAAPCVTCAERSPWQSDLERVSALALRREMIETELAVATAIIVPSEAHRAFVLSLLDLPEDRVTVIPHASIPTVTGRERVRGGAGFPHRPLQIGHWGYLMYLKGTHLILEAVHTLRDPSAVQVHLIGTTLEQAYEQRLRELAQGIPVQFHGAYRPADLETFDLDVAVLASVASESYSFALDEALRLGLPVLVSDRGALPERIGSAGLTFRAGDAGDLARRLQEIIDTPPILEAMRRSIRLETLFSMEAHVAMVEKIYEDAVHGKTPERNSFTPYLKLITHAKQQVQEREALLADLTQRFAQAEQAIHMKEALVQQGEQAIREKEALVQQAEQEILAKERLLQQAEKAIHEKELLTQEQETLLQHTRRDLELLKEDHTNLRAYLQELRRTPLFKLQQMLTKLSRRP
jgi:glycosyltransferase involved in cell wall biosynthesis